MVNYFIKHYESDSVLLISKDGQFKFCSISVTELVLWYRLVT